MKKIIFLVIISTGLLFQVSAQDFKRDTILSTIQTLLKHPFDNTQFQKKSDIFYYIKKEFPITKGDTELIEVLRRNINPSVVCVFIKYYFLGKAFWKYANNAFYSSDSAKLQGMESMNEIYRKIRQQNSNFKIPLMDNYVRFEANNDLKRYVRKYMQDRLYNGEPMPGIVVGINGIALNPEYGYVPDNPVKIGETGSQAELGFLKRLRSPDGNHISYKLVCTACNGHFYNKITGENALLDVYKIKVSDSHQPLYLYIDTYHQDTVYCPMGLSYKD